MWCLQILDTWGGHESPTLCGRQVVGTHRCQAWLMPDKQSMYRPVAVLVTAYTVKWTAATSHGNLTLTVAAAAYLQL